MRASRLDWMPAAAVLLLMVAQAAAHQEPRSVVASGGTLDCASARHRMSATFAQPAIHATANAQRIHVAGFWAARAAAAASLSGDAPHGPRFWIGEFCPNPFQPRATLAFHLPEPRATTAAVFDASGRLVRTLIDARLPAGRHVLAWDGRYERGAPASSGLYVLRFCSGGDRRCRKLILVR